MAAGTLLTCWMHASTSCCSAGKVVVNFHPELRVLIAEAHYLDRKGFSIPPLALQVALQQGEYRAWTENLERLLQLFYSVSCCQADSRQDLQGPALKNAVGLSTLTCSQGPIQTDTCIQPVVCSVN